MNFKSKHFFALLFISFTVIAKSEVIHVLYSSDSHYGAMCKFRGEVNVPCYRVNLEMLSKMNLIPFQKLPDDNGVGAGEIVGAVEMIINTGDVTNRMQRDIQDATTSWFEFQRDWFGFLDIKRIDGAKAPVYVIPGNHDVSNAIGHYAISRTDATGMAAMYNEMMHPAEPRTADAYDYATDKIHFAIESYGIRFLFINMWPDHNERLWVDSLLRQVSVKMPVLMFAHDEPNVVARHFINPNPPHDINNKDRFENLLADTCEVKYFKGDISQTYRGLGRYFRENSIIKGYFHGHNNYNEFYDFKDDTGNPVIPCFRVDAPVKTAYPGTDETQLSFMLISIDTENYRLTARECLWNRPEQPIVFGQYRTIDLSLE